jgi:ankyrin repeat protein
MPRSDRALSSERLQNIDPKDKARNDIFLRAVTESDLARVRRCLDSGININAVDDKGQTAMMIAEKANDHNLVQLLLFGGAAVQSPREDKPSVREPSRAGASSMQAKTSF